MDGWLKISVESVICMIISSYVPQVPTSLISPPKLCPIPERHLDTVTNMPNEKLLSFHASHSAVYIDLVAVA